MAFYKKKKYTRPVYREPTDVDRKLALKKNMRGTVVLIGENSIPYEYTARYLDSTEFELDIMSLLSVFNVVSPNDWNIQTSSLVDVYSQFDDSERESE